MPHQTSHPEFGVLHRKSREESRKQDTAHSTKELARSLIPSFFRNNKDSRPKNTACRGSTSRFASEHRRSVSRYQPQEEEPQHSVDIEIPLRSTASCTQQRVPGRTLHTGFSEVSTGGIGVMVNFFGEPSSEGSERSKGHRGGVDLTLRRHIKKGRRRDSSDDVWSDSESCESNKARVGRKPVPVGPKSVSRRSRSGTRGPRVTSLSYPTIPTATRDTKDSQQASKGRQGRSAAIFTSARDSDKSCKRSSQHSEKASRQSSNSEKQPISGGRQSVTVKKRSSTRDKQKALSSRGGRISPKTSAPTSKKENTPPEVEIPPRYDTKTHVCYCCGKTRSRDYQLDHPIDARIGAKPSLCGPCDYTITLSGNLPGRLEHKRAYLSGLHWCASCGTLRSTKFHLNQQRLGPKSSASAFCAVYETWADKEDIPAPVKNSNLASHQAASFPESSPSCTTVDIEGSPNPNYPSDDDEAPMGRRTRRPVLRSILINTAANDRETGHSAGTAWVSKGVSDSSSETHVHFTNPEISGLTEAPNYDRSPIELDHPEQASHPSPMIPSARRAQPVEVQPSTETSSSRDSGPPHPFPRPVGEHNHPVNLGATGSAPWDPATQDDGLRSSYDFCLPAPSHEGVPLQDARHPGSSYTHHSESGYKSTPTSDQPYSDHSRRWSTLEHHPVFDASIPNRDYRHSSDFSSRVPPLHHSSEEIKPFSGYYPSPPTEEEEPIRPLSGYFPPRVDDYCPTPSLLDEPIHHQPHFPTHSSSTDTFGHHRSPSVTPEPSHARGGQAYRFPDTEPSYGNSFFATRSDPSSTRSSQTARPSSAYLSADPSPVFGSSSGGSRGPSPTTDSSADAGATPAGYHAFTSDARRRAESEARLFAAAGYSAPVPEEEEYRGPAPEEVVWEVDSDTAAEIEKEHVERVGVW